jgi:hypothetical protein
MAGHGCLRRSEGVAPGRERAAKAGVGSGFPFLLDFGLFHDELSDEQRAAMGREVSAVAVPGATLLMVAWAPGRRGRPYRYLRKADPRLYRLRRD